MEDEKTVWVKDTQWVKLEAPRSCRRIDGSPRTHCPNMAKFGLMRSNDVWAYCEQHLYGRRIRDGVVEFKVRPYTIAAKQGWV